MSTGTGEFRVLRALGVRPSELLAVAVVPAVAAVALGSLVAVMTAVALSPLFPIGLARKAEVDTGVHADVLVLALGSVMVIAALLVISFISASAGASTAAARRPR